MAKISRQDSVSSVPPATPSPVEKTAPPIITRPDYAAGLGPLSSDTGSTLYGDHPITSSHPPPTTPSMYSSKLFLAGNNLLFLYSTTFYPNITISSLSKAVIIINSIYSSNCATTFTHYAHTISTCCRRYCCCSG